MIDVSVLSTVAPPRDMLPAPINTNFPHIRLELGSDANKAGNPMLRCVVDTAAALTTGNFHFVSAIAKKYPHCLAKLFVPDDYTPIILSGIVQRGGESVTTELTVGFQFHLPYFTRTGQPTSLLIATGPHVTVNTIVGLPFIQATGMVIDLSDHVADLRALDTVPFPIEYRRATVHVPVVGEGAAPVNLANYGDLIAEIENLERHFANQIALTTTLDPAASVPHVTFGSSTGHTFGASQTSVHDSILHGKTGLVHRPLDEFHHAVLGTAAFE